MTLVEGLVQPEVKCYNRVMKSGVFIVIDGIAGSGKSTIVRSWKEWIATQDVQTFDLLEWTQSNDAPPTLEDIGNADVLFTFEPTKQWIGSAIRQEMSHGSYTGTEHAHAFALDRLIAYRRLIIPALQAGKTIIQDRSVSSSIAYQPIMPGGPTLEEILKLPGNALALEHAPTHLVLTDIAPAEVVSRLKRNDDSKGVFEDMDLLTKIHERYRSQWYREIFTTAGTQIHDLDTSTRIDTTILNATSLLTSLLKEE